MALGAILVPAGFAHAEHRDGAYVGATGQAQPITFRVDDGRVKRLEVEVYADCEDGTRQVVTVTAGRTRIDESRFSLELTGDDELKVVVSGRFIKSHASGAIRASLRPPGTVCATETRWHASPKPATS